ncbi:YiiX/YebB-like N1pC/P60 family cysteine hydrolase [Pseudothauera lacus]|uniref:Permuted papain-like amidase YaeF/Yiix C92 family enzyme n=1 Tax=Pseudothauera lacus TaxID=2136175 RepID=A0A2T4IC00_9RHOO|nr:YiiX/YebB-like N1pC/P60 family cysteine hydrolase [Pseudothauera lacus]PTD95305.1 hypothetical protein C8261_14905 [Pseudothauera lacus]
MEAVARLKARRWWLAALIATLATLAALGVSALPAAPGFDARNVRLDNAEEGDWVFRRTTSAAGAAARWMSSFPPYSHVGMLIAGPDGWQVIHASPGDDHEAAGVTLVSLEAFLQRPDVNAAGVFRVRDSTAAQRRTMAAAAHSMLGRPFDHLYALDDDSALYCTELLWLAARQAALLDGLSARELATPFGRVAVLTLDTVLSPELLERVDGHTDVAAEQ